MNRKGNRKNEHRPLSGDEAGVQREEKQTDLEWEEYLLSGLRKFDESYSVVEPDGLTLWQMLEEHKQNEKRKKRKELALFLSIGVVLLSGSTALYRNEPLAIIAVQGAALLLPSLYLSVKLLWRESGSRKRVD